MSVSPEYTTMNIHLDLKEVTMKRNSIAKILMAMLQTLIACSLLLGVSAMAEPVDKPCTNRTLFGDYGSVGEGVLLNVPGLPPEAQFRALTMTHFDGKGNLSWVEHTVINGTLLEPGWTAASGTYSVNPDCTGTAVVNTPNSPVPLNLAFVVVKHGTEVHTVLDTDAVTSVFTKVR
jgi:hypothetical protein